MKTLLKKVCVAVLAGTMWSVALANAVPTTAPAVPGAAPGAVPGATVRGRG